MTLFVRRSPWSSRSQADEVTLQSVRPSCTRHHPHHHYQCAPPGLLVQFLLLQVRVRVRVRVQLRVRVRVQLRVRVRVRVRVQVLLLLCR